jgi:hypothetical protein
MKFYTENPLDRTKVVIDDLLVDLYNCNFIAGFEHGYNYTFQRYEFYRTKNGLIFLSRHYFGSEINGNRPEYRFISEKELKSIIANLSTDLYLLLFKPKEA